MNLPTRAISFFWFYVCALLYLSLYPWQFLGQPRDLVWLPLYSRGTLLDGLLNVSFYVPLGAALFFTLDGGVACVLFATLTGGALSFGVEWTQRYIPSRMATYDDLIANSLGAALGAAMAFTWKSLRKSRLHDLFARSFSPEGAVFAALWVLWHGLLLLPVVKHVGLPRAAVESATFWTDSVNVFFGFLAMSLALESRTKTTILLALLPVPVLAAYPPLLLARLFAAGTAILAGRALGALRLRLPSVAFLVWLAWEELWPFRWGSPQPFLWFPFETLFSIRTELYYPVISGKLFIYTAVVWAMRCRGARWLWALGLPVAVLAAGESAQRFLPGRTPELTDVVLMASGAVLLRLAEPETRARHRHDVD
jgi:VanZ family protein